MPRATQRIIHTDWDIGCDMSDPEDGKMICDVEDMLLPTSTRRVKANIAEDRNVHHFS